MSPTDRLADVIASSGRNGTPSSRSVAAELLAALVVAATTPTTAATINDLESREVTPER
jgi:hypothetical protein